MLSYTLTRKSSIYDLCYNDLNAHFFIYFLSSILFSSHIFFYLMAKTSFYKLFIYLAFTMFYISQSVAAQSHTLDIISDSNSLIFVQKLTEADIYLFCLILSLSCFYIKNIFHLQLSLVKKAIVVSLLTGSTLYFKLKISKKTLMIELWQNISQKLPFYFILVYFLYILPHSLKHRSRQVSIFFTFFTIYVFVCFF